MATPLSYLYTERWRDWKVVYKALKPSRTNNFRSSNVLSFSSSLPRFQAPNPSTPVPFVLFVTRTCLWAQWLCWSFLSSSCQFKRLPKHILRSCYCFTVLYDTFSPFFPERIKSEIYLHFFSQTKIIVNVCRYKSMEMHFVSCSPSIILHISTLYVLHYKSGGNDGTHPQGKSGILWSKCFPCN